MEERGLGGREGALHLFGTTPPNLPAQHISISAASARPGESLAGNQVFSFVLRGPFPTHRTAWCSPAPAPALVIAARPRWLGLGSGAFVRLERGEEEPTAFVWLQHSWGLILRFLPPPQKGCGARQTKQRRGNKRAAGLNEEMSGAGDEAGGSRSVIRAGDVPSIQSGREEGALRAAA